ncbi:SdpI family protein [Paraclostridium bifermentans]|uniref:SdpI family protein n=1 Tax=Paraclostridium bifermentans TaxID=1490 RepID=A0AA44DJD9_PARBF|nr:SdpI family protein [Paraclostridium bifermentans]MBN8047275.1 SdpI family protein [Paraclostridium bifermentans]NME08653.1 SdpI family protein [Paraclostridium bifermentans]
MIIISLVGVLFLISSLLLKSFPPPRNNVYGYRTLFSMKNENTWKEGNI